MVLGQIRNQETGFKYIFLPLQTKQNYVCDKKNCAGPQK